MPFLNYFNSCFGVLSHHVIFNHIIIFLPTMVLPKSLFLFVCMFSLLCSCLCSNNQHMLISIAFLFFTFHTCLLFRNISASNLLHFRLSLLMVTFSFSVMSFVHAQISLSLSLSFEGDFFIEAYLCLPHRPQS